MYYFLIAALVPLVAMASNLLTYAPWFSSLISYLDKLYALAGPVSDLPSFPFWCLFVFRYLRLVVHLFSFWCLYRPIPIPVQPTLRPQDCSVILPTVDPENPEFQGCIHSCLNNQPGEIIIVTVGRNMAALTNQIVGPLRGAFPSTNIQVHFTDIANKRRQVAHGVLFATGKVIVLLDDHVFWKSFNFLPTILAPFEDDKVGGVGTNKRVRRTDTGFNIRSFWNMIGALYLERHNFEIRATNAIDGGVFVISGRTAAYRASILQQPGFMEAFINERFFFRKFGPLNADDDNFLTRQVVTQGYDIKIQYNQDALIETTLGTYPKFLSQCLRWVRTTWRSNLASLITDRTVWTRQPWCVYAVYITSLVNFALFYDATLIYTCRKFANPSSLYLLLGWIFFTKMIKLTPYFMREPQDLLMLPGYFIFAYFHSLIKLYAGLTFWVTTWGGRNLDAINQATDSGDDDDNRPCDHSRSQSPTVSAQHLSSGSETSVPDQPSSSSSHDSSDDSSIDPWRNATPTPWGTARNYHNMPVRPANILESQVPRPTTATGNPPPHYLAPLPTPSNISSLPSPSTHPKPHPKSITTLPSSHPFTLPRERHGLDIPDDHTRTWTRGKQCQSLHSDRDRLFKTRGCQCEVSSLFRGPRDVVFGRPRV